MPQQLPQKPILCIRYSDPRETVIDQEPQQELRILAIRLLRWRTRFVRISAAPPIHNSNCGRTAQLLRGE